MYRKHTNGEISANQAFIIIISIMIGTGVLGLSRVVSQVSKQDAWISVLINGILISLITMAIVYVASRFPQDNFLQYSSRLLSKPIGYIITISFALYGLLATATIIRFLTEMILTWFLPDTPIYVIIFLIIATSVYMLSHGLTVLARFNEVIIFLLVPLALLVAVGIPEIRLVNLRPIGGTGLKSILSGVVPSFFAFGGYEVMLVYYPYISDKEKPVAKYSMISVIIVTLFYTTTVISQMALFGPEELQRVLYPSINYLRAYDFPIIERMELFFTIFWLFTVLGTIGLQYFAGCSLLQSIFKTKTTGFFVFLQSPILFVLTLLPRNTPQVVEIGGIIGKANIFFGLLLPLLLLIMVFVHGGKSKHEKNS
ncbi:GerAB/ArcD/ProY family transporter [Alkaliphilus hydrothermalis]|uniref:Spore germination protein (Amino acid permease) n=1 Tax=Alkaliphilus hydrothermalis TaxID=1482730 RepID=A0ABS2NS60_9FIRM|nr:endospore germination permease [Alkaliphilus hydrothermalis]MBM7615766.1 spore germination protein (amino acid permease) [Alkaliphilus hydrothermalis]